jgi:hypothetical protein
MAGGKYHYVAKRSTGVQKVEVVKKPHAKKGRYTNVPMVISQSKKVVLPYAQNIWYTVTPLGFKDIRFRLNSLYDPYYENGGHVPLGVNQWTSFYGRYRVDKAKVTVTLFNAHASGTLLTLVGNNETSIFSNNIAGPEQHGAISKGMSPNGQAITITKTYDLKKIVGVSKATYEADDRYQAFLGADPAEHIIMHLMLTTPAEVDYTAGIHVKILYYATLSDTRSIPISG